MAGQGLFQRLQLNDDAADTAVADEDIRSAAEDGNAKSKRRAARIAKDISLTDSGSTNTSAGPPTAMSYVRSSVRSAEFVLWEWIT